MGKQAKDKASDAELEGIRKELIWGESGVRDLGMLDAALHRPRPGYYSSLSEQAAALLQSLANNHAFVDGNKRVAFATMAIR